MLRTFSYVGGGMIAFAAFLSLIGSSTSSPSASSGPPEKHGQVPAATNALAPAAESAGSGDEHGHKTGAHGGIIVSLGRDSYHVEAIVTSTGELRLYTLGNDESRVIDVEVQELIAYVKTTGGSDSISIEIKPQPQPGDAAGKASLFVAQLPESVVGRAIDVTVPSITISGERFRLGFSTKSETHGAETMPNKLGQETEQQLYLTPAGLYSQRDIEANGNVTASQKFAGFQASHDLKPKVGDKICPVTLTKANPKCTWIVGGKIYEFCCPPCVDEFVSLAKTKPDEVKQPEQYIKSETATGAEVK